MAWDPLNKMVLTQSADRSVRTYRIKSKNPMTMLKLAPSGGNNGANPQVAKMHGGYEVPEGAEMEKRELTAADFGMDEEGADATATATATGTKEKKDKSNSNVSGRVSTQNVPLLLLVFAAVPSFARVFVLKNDGYSPLTGKYDVANLSKCPMINIATCSGSISLRLACLSSSSSVCSNL